MPVTFIGRRQSLRDHPARGSASRSTGTTAVAAAERQGGGFGIVRGYRRLELSSSRRTSSRRSRAYDAALSYELRLLGNAIDRTATEARLVRRGLHVTIASGATGHVLDQDARAGS